MEILIAILALAAIVGPIISWRCASNRKPNERLDNFSRCPRCRSNRFMQCFCADCGLHARHDDGVHDLLEKLRELAARRERMITGMAEQ